MMNKTLEPDGSETEHETETRYPTETYQTLRTLQAGRMRSLR